MSQKNETPADKAGARGDLLGGWSRTTTNLISTGLQFPDHRQEALALLNGNYRLTRNAGKFLGQLAVDSTPLSERQADWLRRLLDKYQPMRGNVLPHLKPRAG